VESPGSTRDLLAFLDSKLNDLMFGLYRTRQTLMTTEARACSDELRGQMREAHASLREQERALADIQERIGAVRRASAQP
jgi:hypothetical protein